MCSFLRLIVVVMSRSNHRTLTLTLREMVLGSGSEITTNIPPGVSLQAPVLTTVGDAQLGDVTRSILSSPKVLLDMVLVAVTD